MNWEEFEQKVGMVLSNYGFTYSEAMIYWRKTVRHIWTNSSMMPGKPDAVFEYTYDEDRRNIYISYYSIMYHYSPSGQHSITGKNYDQRYKETDIKKFKWETLEKWAKCQQETVSMARKLYKEYEIEKKMKAAAKDFK